MKLKHIEGLPVPEDQADRYKEEIAWLKVLSGACCALALSVGGWLVRNYDSVSFAISDALAHAAQRLAPKAGESVVGSAT